MTDKSFIGFEEIRNNALLLGRAILDSGFLPDVLYVSLRGGAYLGNVLSEYLNLHRPSGRKMLYAAVVAHSYTDIRSQQAIRVDGWTYDPQYLRSGDKILFVDDIYDSGRTINYLVDVILAKGLPRSDVRVAVHDYKRYADRDTLPIVPDYYCRLWDIYEPKDDLWIHYLSHELVGLTMEEIERNYLRKGQEEKLQEVLRSIPSLRNP